MKVIVHTERLKVKSASAEDAWKDIVRIPNKYRRDHEKKHISRGKVCCITAEKRSKWVIVHGLDTPDAVIRMDLNVRLALKLKNEEEYDFTFKKIGRLKALWFPWRASDPIFRLPGQLGLIVLFLGVILGIAGIVVGVVPLYHEYQKEKNQAQRTKVQAQEIDGNVAITTKDESSNSSGTVDFVNAWKAVSIVLTGGFGILGLLKDFKNKKTKRVTSWGYVSLLGILLSTVLGVAAQLKESSDTERAKRKTSEQTLALAQKSERTIRDIQRVLSPLDDPHFTLWFTVDCAGAKYKASCGNIQRMKEAKRARGEHVTTEDFGNVWSQNKFDLLLDVDFFATQKDADDFSAFRRIDSDLLLKIIAFHSKRDQKSRIFIDGFFDDVRIGLIDVSPIALFTKNNGHFKSILDLPGVVIIVRELNDELSRLKLESIEIKFKNGQSIRYRGPFAISSVQRATAYRFTVPQDEFISQYSGSSATPTPTQQGYSR